MGKNNRFTRLFQYDAGCGLAKSNYIRRFYMHLYWGGLFALLGKYVNWQRSGNQQYHLIEPFQAKKNDPKGSFQLCVKTVKSFS